MKSDHELTQILLDQDLTAALHLALMDLKHTTPLRQITVANIIEHQMSPETLHLRARNADNTMYKVQEAESCLDIFLQS